MKSNLVVFLLLICIIFLSCRKDIPLYRKYKSTKVIVLIIDGPRYQETYGRNDRKYIPFQNQMSKEGTLCTSFYNYGVTNTVNGHTAICTGNYESLNNSGLDVPSYPSYMQYYIKNKKADKNKVWIIASKDKLQVLANTTNSEYKNKFMPQTDCGINGLFTGYREDSITQFHVMTTLQSHHPDVLLVNYKEPDVSGHANNWGKYLLGIQNTDKYVHEVWDFIQNDPYYKDQTTLIITNDHGRHDDGWKDGFVSHGDNCDGCRHISLLALGPDIKKNYVSTNDYSQIDITSTIASIFQLQMPFVKGKLMEDIFMKNQK